jgi:hypothetical protein
MKTRNLAQIRIMYLPNTSYYHSNLLSGFGAGKVIEVA